MQKNTLINKDKIHPIFVHIFKVKNINVCVCMYEHIYFRYEREDTNYITMFVYICCSVNKSHGIRIMLVIFGQFKYNDLK